MTWGEEFANTNREQLYSKNRVWRSVIGVDRPTFVSWINPHRTTLFSAQLFWQHIFDHERENGGVGERGIPDFKDNVIGTLLMKGFLAGDRISPQLIIARDFRSRTHAIAPALEWSTTDKLCSPSAPTSRAAPTGAIPLTTAARATPSLPSPPAPIRVTRWWRTPAACPAWSPWVASAPAPSAPPSGKTRSS
jgi:hypothetical protein